jgi:DNA-binding MarR family transcriptional regulator
MSNLTAGTSPVAVGDIERAVSSIVAWATRNDVHQETMRRARCALPRGHTWLLARLASSGPVRLGDVAAALGIDNSTLTPQVQRLESEGLVARQPDPTDRRAALLGVTPAGRRLLDRLHSTRRAMFDELLADWSERDRVQAAKVLARLADRLEGSADRNPV